MNHLNSNKIEWKKSLIYKSKGKVFFTGLLMMMSMTMKIWTLQQQQQTLKRQ